MENYLNYKNYYGSVEFSVRDNILFGSIIGIDDLVTYEAESVEELKKAFEESVEDYLETCQTLGKAPDKYFKGVFNVRTSNEKHRALAIIAEKNKLKLNDLVNKAFDYLVKNEDEVLN
jgi:predicted HicB family RNase H-like nuclease